MATNLALDPELLERAFELSGEKTKKGAVTRALNEFIARREQRRIRELLGRLEWDDSYDYKRERSQKAAKTLKCFADAAGDGDLVCGSVQVTEECNNKC